MSKPSRISTPFAIRWQRIRYGIFPFVAVVACATAAWLLWRESPQVTTIGQVDDEVAEVSSPAAGTLSVDPKQKPLQMFDTVAAGQVIGRIEKSNGNFTNITAPIAGQIVKMDARPGQTIKSGDPVMTVSANHARSITAYVKSEQGVTPTPGMSVDVRLKSDPSRKFKAVVERIGPRYQSIPVALLRDRKSEELGLPVILSIPADTGLRPGEVVYVGWSSGKLKGT